MNQLFNIIIKQIIVGYIGASLLLIYYKLKGRKITYDQILNEIDSSGVKKHYYKAFYLGVGFLIITVIVISTMAGLNPKIYNTNK
ncbi:hypothetical protein QRD02_14155 [Aequorivita sp. SDUM287046]|uniref:Uncharacterized protein n=1 Tax=Aequorivita aurantiaca TaxID=3053356 RepID=A0ABT8DNF6_9FLAO|nr:hypothetical protein [Aequorivita aurantiaca]